MKRNDSAILAYNKDDQKAAYLLLNFSKVATEQAHFDANIKGLYDSKRVERELKKAMEMDENVVMKDANVVQADLQDHIRQEINVSVITARVYEE